MSSSSDPRVVAEKRVGQTLANKWTIDRLIDVGGMAAVYQATHRNGKRVAIKMLHPFIAAHEDVRERFLREGYVANQVDHPGAVSVLDDDVTTDGAAFLVMELLEGDSLEGCMTRNGGTLPISDVLAVADQVLDVLAAFHERNVIHRDIKPGNLFVTKQGVVKVLDFGLARLRDPRVGGAPTASGIVLGTAAYMPPEQAQGKATEVDARADIFAVGAVMFRALSGRQVHDARSATERLFQAMKEKAKSLGVVAPEIAKVSLGTVGLVDKALAFDKKERWANAAEMRKAVRTTFAQLKQDAAQQKAQIANEPAPPSADLSQRVSREVSAAFEAVMEPSVIVDVSFADMEVLEDHASGG
jgi:eukaryotic-like serine/threonine-protein kinase